MVLKWSWGIVFLVASLFINLSAYSLEGEFGGVWVDTLNFSHGIGLKSGPHGNVKSIDGKSFDIDEIHTELEKEAKKTARAAGLYHNIVVAGLSLIIKVDDDQYEALYVPLKDSNSIVAFVSGAVGRGYSQQGTTFIGPSDHYVPQELLKSFGERIGSPKDSFLPLRHDVIEGYYKEWMKAQDDALTEAKASIGQLVTQDQESIYSFHKEIQRTVDEKINEANKGFGSAIDSEQYLLRYFGETKTVRGVESTKLLLKYNDLLGKYRIDKLNLLRTRFSKETSRTENVDTIRSGIAKFQQELDQFEKMQEVGCILHLHSINEICCCCSYSLAQELRYGKSNEITENMRTHNNGVGGFDPFFSILVSASQILPEVEVNRPGIGKDSYFADRQDGVVPIEFSIARGVFLQKLLISASSTASTSSSTN